MRIILLGPAGSGKGTQGELIERHYGFPHISTGDLFRLEVMKGSELGKMVAEVINSGQLVADELVLRMVRDRIADPDCRAGYVLDGFPRTLNQALLLEKIEDGHPETVLEILLSEEAVMERLSGRLVCPGCGAVYNIHNNKEISNGRCPVCGTGWEVRTDDRPEVIRERFRIYREAIGPLREHYSRQQVLFQVDGSRSVDEVFNSIKTILDERIAGARGESSRP